MKIRILLTLLIAIMAIQVASAQSLDTRTSLNVVRLVTDATSQLNNIYRQRVSGHEMEQAALQKAIYAANNELFAIREELTGGNVVRNDKLTSLQKQVETLQSAITAVDANMSDADLAKAIIVGMRILLQKRRLIAA